jgi:iron complex outermembrane receptor protein
MRTSATIALALAGWACGQTPPDLSNATLEQLMDIQVTSVSKKGERLSKVAASVFVITAEDIRRSGLHSLPEILRLAPGHHHSWI